MFNLTEWQAMRYEILSTPGLGVGIICKEGVDKHADNPEYADLTTRDYKSERTLAEILRLVIEHEEMYHS